MNTENLTSWKCLFCLSRTFLGRLCSFVVSENNFSSLLYSSLRYVCKEPWNSFIACIFLELLANVGETTVLFHYLNRYFFFFFLSGGGGIRNRHKTRFKQLNHEGESLENIHEVVVLPLADDNLNNNVQYI